MKEQIQKLIAAGRLEEALELLAKMTEQAILLQARFADGKRQYNTGQLSFSEWSQVQAKLNYAALEMLNQAKPMPATEDLDMDSDQDADDSPKGTGGKRKVFISYSQKDLETAEKVVDYLRSKGLDPLIDNEVLKPGENIQDFVTRAIRENNAILFLVSANSLLSGWVGLEIIMSNYAKDLIDAQLIPVALDKSWLNTEDTTDLLIALKKEIDKQYEQRKKRAEINASSADIDRKLKR
ncbi:TIR domain-containing protein, partial [Runella sp.]|uniref:TIR domain-containing protein n=1 Tax=Runella sp. TaxID=1960881 RepID=UPI00301A439E